MVTSGVYKSVRSGVRVLQVLAALNTLRSASVLDLARSSGISRTTVYRFLETLIREGYVIHDDQDNRYRPTVMVRGLSDGFDDHVWLAQVGRDPLIAAGKEVSWPVALSVPSGTFFAVIRTTDSTSPLAVEKRGPGYRRPILESASGLCYLAFCPPGRQTHLLNLLCRRESGSQDLGLYRDIEVRIAEIKRIGYSLYHRPGRRSDRSALAVPITIGETPIGTVTVRYARSALGDSAARAAFLEPLRRASRKIQTAFTAAQALHAEIIPPTLR